MLLLCWFSFLHRSDITLKATKRGHRMKTKVKRKAVDVRNKTQTSLLTNRGSASDVFKLLLFLFLVSLRDVTNDSMRYPDRVRFAVSVKEKTSSPSPRYTSWYPEPDVCSYSIVCWEVQSTTTGRSRPQQRSSKKSMRFLIQPWLKTEEQLKNNPFQCCPSSD